MHWSMISLCVYYDLYDRNLWPEISIKMTPYLGRKHKQCFITVPTGRINLRSPYLKMIIMDLDFKLKLGAYLYFYAITSSVKSELEL